VVARSANFCTVDCTFGAIDEAAYDIKFDIIASTRPLCQLNVEVYQGQISAK